MGHYLVAIWSLLCPYCGTIWGLLTDDLETTWLLLILTDVLVETTKELLGNYSGTPWGQLGHILDSTRALLGHYKGTASRYKLQLG